MILSTDGVGLSEYFLKSDLGDVHLFPFQYFVLLRIENDRIEPLNMIRMMNFIGIVLICPLLTACGPTRVVGGSIPPLVLTKFGKGGCSQSGNCGQHAGIDYVGNTWTPVIATADGIVHTAMDTKPNSCGKMVVVWHIEYGLFTINCHLSQINVREGERVLRGKILGRMGSSGGQRRVHLHFELNRAGTGHDFGQADLDGEFVKDPSKHIVGCFDPDKQYPEDRLVLVYPIPCW